MESKVMNRQCRNRQMNPPEKIDIFGTKISKTNLEAAAEFLKMYRFSKPEYVCFPSTGIIALAHNEPKFRNILNNSVITFADGKFTEYYAKIKGHRGIKNVSGYWLMDKLLRTKRTHYFYGCDNFTLKRLKNNLSLRYPEARILGFKAPPYVSLDEICGNETIVEDIAEICRLEPDFIWIGISSPKQDYLMHHYCKYLNHGTMIGVGAVFLYQAGVIKKGPEVLKKFALRALYRCIQEPRRIMGRSIPRVARFLMLILKYDVFNRKNRCGEK
jgi:N-acetylglucosaminyldiphosphoundecaprenol N-acetyl-beta-D-mannosaminyltransferase